MAFWEVLGPRGGGAQWVMGYQIKGMDSLYLPDPFPAILEILLFITFFKNVFPKNCPFSKSLNKTLTAKSHPLGSKYRLKLGFILIFRHFVIRKSLVPVKNQIFWENDHFGFYSEI